MIMKEQNNQKCCLCGKKIVGYGRSALPVMEGRCCDLCKTNRVKPIIKELLDAISIGHI